MKATGFIINEVQKNLPSHWGVPIDLINLALTNCEKIMELFGWKRKRRFDCQSISQVFLPPTSKCDTNHFVILSYHNFWRHVEITCTHFAHSNKSNLRRNNSEDRLRYLLECIWMRGIVGHISNWRDRFVARDAPMNKVIENLLATRSIDV